MEREKTRTRGGSPEEFQGKSDKLRPLVDAYVARGNASEKYRRYRELELDFDKVFEGSDGDYEEWMEKHGKEFEKLARDPEVRAILDERAAVAKQFGNSLAVLRVMKYPNDPKAWKAVAMDDESYKEAQYRRLAGEVEARNAQKRLYLTAEQKRKKLLADTEDVAEEDKSYLEEALQRSDERGEMREERGSYLVGDTGNTRNTGNTGKSAETKGLEQDPASPKGSAAAMGAKKKPYYLIPFADGLKRVVDPAQKGNRDPVYVRDTPKVFRDIGFTALPMIMNARHLRLNFYTEEEFTRIYGRPRNDEHPHGLHDLLLKLPKALENPLSIVVNKAENAKPGSVVAITDMNVKGKKIVVPVLIEAESNVDGTQIDSHLVLTVYDESDWIKTFLNPALDEEKKGIGVFYFNEEKAARYSALSNRKGAIPTGLVHTIAQAGIIVKPQTKTLQFKRWFGDSQVVDKNGEPFTESRFKKR